MKQQDYTGTQTAAVQEIERMPDHDESREQAQMAQAAYRAAYGKRPYYIHVKGSKRCVWHFSEGSDGFMKYITRFPANKIVLYQHGEPKGWAFHNEVEENWFDCGEGRCFKGPLRPMKTFVPYDVA